MASGAADQWEWASAAVQWAGVVGGWSWLVLFIVRVC